MKKILILSLHLSIAIGLFGHDSIDSATTHNDKSNIDTVVIIQKIDNDILIKEYQEILEKTNSQLGLWTNPYGILIGIIGVLFAGGAIVSGIILFRQSSEYKNSIKANIEEHNNTINNLIKEKNKQFLIYETNLNNLISEYESKGFDELVSRLKEQRNVMESIIHTYNHSGWNPKDIPLQYLIYDNTYFVCTIDLHNISQMFIVYLKIINNDNKSFWIGFAGNTGSVGFGRLGNEFTKNKMYSETIITIDENIRSYFKEGFPNVKSYPVQITQVRLRGNNNIKQDITYSFKIVDK